MSDLCFILLTLTQGVYSVQWMPVCVYSSRKHSVSLEACASLGEIKRHFVILIFKYLETFFRHKTHL